MSNLFQSIVAICTGCASFICAPQDTISPAHTSLSPTHATLLALPPEITETMESLQPALLDEEGDFAIIETTETEAEASAQATETVAVASAATTISEPVAIATNITEVEDTPDTANAIPLKDDGLFLEMETWFKAYMDYRHITDVCSVQYTLQQQAWTDSKGLRRIGGDYLVAMGTGWLETGCGERFLITLEGKKQITIMVGDIKADCDTDSTNRFRWCGGGANVLEFIVDTRYLAEDVKESGTVSTYEELAGNIVEIAKIENTN